MGSVNDQAIQAAVERSRQQDAANRRLQQIISQLDQLTLANRNLMQPLAEALAALVGQPVAITGIAPDPQSGMLGSIAYVTPDGGQHTLAIDRAPTTPASQIALPGQRP
jgi:type II secretory pathway pseudopilin PulG